ncbi:MAG: hydroxyacid dehydrogenase [Calditrichaceae bacterium]|nr:hydroxyacid dehydrogenase [Calditrichaceae bacterium]
MNSSITFKFDVYFYEAFEEEALEIQKYMPSNIKAGYTWTTIQEAGHANPLAPIISVRTQSQFPPAWSDKLQGILSRSTGYDHLIRYKVKTNTSAKLAYLPLYCNRAVAEQAMLLWMALLRKLPQQMQSFKQFHRDGLTGFECEGKRLLVVGVGNIGSQIIQIGKGLGMKVQGVDLVKKHPGIEYVKFEEAIANADIIVSAMNLTSENAGYFNYDKLKQAKKGIIFINIARGELSPIKDLLRLIEENHLGGLALDVYENEVAIAHALRQKETVSDELIKATLKLAEYPNVILTPHNAFNTNEAVERKAEQSVQQIEYYLKHNNFKWTVPE